MSINKLVLFISIFSCSIFLSANANAAITNCTQAKVSDNCVMCPYPPLKPTTTVPIINNSVPKNSIPSWVNIDIVCHCYDGWGIVSDSWISPQDQSSATSTTVYGGDNSIPLDLNAIFYRCKVNTPVNTKINGTKEVTFISRADNTDIQVPISFVGSYPTVDKGGNQYNMAVIRKVIYTSPTSINASKDLTIPLYQRGWYGATNDINRCSIWKTGDYNGVPIENTSDKEKGGKNCATANRPFTIHVVVLPRKATISTSSSSSAASAYPGTSVTLTNNINISNVQGTGSDGYTYTITDTSVGGTLPGTGTASGTKKYTDGNLSSPFTFTIPTGTTVSKYCRTITISNNTSYASVSSPSTTACVNVNLPTTSISTSSSSSAASAYPGTSVTLTNNINISNVQGTGSDGYTYTITDTSVGGTLPGTGTASGTKKYTDGNLSSPFTFTIPTGTTVSKYCRTITISNNTSYASVSSPSTTACVNVTYPPILTCSNSNYQETGFNGPIGYAVTNNNSTAITYGVNASINSPTSVSILPGNSFSVSSNSTATGTVSFGTNLPIGKHTLTINLTDNGNQVATVNCGLNIVLRPYFKVYGGGVMTGSNFMDSNGTCTNSTSNIVAFNNGTNGSSTDQAIFSSGYVYGMGSQQSSNSSGTSLLTFANTPNTIFGNYGAIGGSFEGIQCMPDYYSQLKSLQGVSVDTTASPNITSFTQGINIYTGGDVKISENITLPNTIPTTGLPFMYIIAYGHDIYINNSVNEVDAVLIAEPNNGNVGHIYTCENNVQNNAFSLCKNNPLTIKGALLASQVHLLRTGSNNSTASSSVNATGGCETSFNGAEQICMSPLYWLTNPFSEITNTTTTTTDYIQQLPPTL